jgi:hypothetical protein
MGTMMRNLLKFIQFIELAEISKTVQTVNESVPDINYKPSMPRVDRSKAKKKKKSFFQRRKRMRTIQEHSRVMNR